MSVKYHYDGFPPKNLDWPKLVPLLGPAASALAKYDGVLEALPNEKVLLSPLTTHEAVLSSQIEGTQATMDEVLEFEAENLFPGEQEPEKTNDIYEILNYRQAIRSAEKGLVELPLCGRILKNAHEILLDSVRGKNKNPGQYRRIQNWIGTAGCTEEEAKFVPIAPGDALENGMAAWERYIHNEEPDRLVQLAIVHAEFEALHPFADGNGRLGRMIIPLFLYSNKLLRAPTFYISEYLEAHRDIYYERLLAISRDGDWTGWCEFFLRAVIEQAKIYEKGSQETALRLTAFFCRL